MTTTATTTPERSAATDVAHADRFGRARAVIESGLILVGLVALLLLLDHHVYADAEVRYQSLSTLLGEGRLDASKYSLIGPLFSAPIWYVGGWLHIPHRGVGIYNWCVFAVGVGALYWLLKDRVERGLLRTFLLLLIAGSLFPFHLTNYYGEVFTAVSVAVGLVAIQSGRPYLGWPAVVLGVANTPASLPALGLAMLVRVYQTRRLRCLLAVAAAAALIAGENWLRRGGPFATNYESGFDAPFFGLLAILFSFGKGLIFFVPGLFVPVRRALDPLVEPVRRLLRSTHALWVAFVIGLVAVYASWWGWDGGWFWGPRFFLVASFPACLAVALRLRQSATTAASRLATLATVALLALCMWVGVNSAVYGDAPLADPCIQQRTLCDYTPQYSALWRPLAAPPPQLSPRSAAYVVYALIVFGYLAWPLMYALAARFLQGARHIPRHLRAWRF